DRAVRRNGGELRAQDAVQEARRLLENDKSAEALSYIIQAEAIVANSGGGEDIMRESGRLRQDLEMLERLDETRLAPKAFDRGSGDQVDYTEAFAKYGLDLDRLDPEEAAERIRNRPISRQLIAAIDDWAVIAKRRRLPAWQRLLAVARLADPDRWRNRLRDAIEGGDRAFEEVLQAASPQGWPAATLGPVSKPPSASEPA